MKKKPYDGMGKPNHSGGIFSEGAFWLSKAWITLFCASLNNVCGHPSGKWYPYSHQHLRLPPSHPYVLLPGEPLLPGHLLHQHGGNEDSGVVDVQEGEVPQEEVHRGVKVGV